jgi:hypothetical protein
MAGYELFDHDGEKLWSCQPLDDHADCMVVGKIRPDLPHDRIAIGGSVTVLYASEGTELWPYTGSKESQHVAVGKYSDSASKVQIAGLDRIKRGHDGMFLLTSAGEGIWKEDRKVRGWLTIIETLTNWDSIGTDHIFAYRRRCGLMPALYNCVTQPVITFPLDGRVVRADLLGRGQTDVLIYTDDEAAIFTSTAYDLSEVPSGNALPHPKRLSHQTLYPCSEYPSG